MTPPEPGPPCINSDFACPLAPHRLVFAPLVFPVFHPCCQVIATLPQAVKPFYMSHSKSHGQELSDRPHWIGQRQDLEAPSLHTVRALCCPCRPSRSPQIGRNAECIEDHQVSLCMLFSYFVLDLLALQFLLSSLDPVFGLECHHIILYPCRHHAQRRAPHDNSINFLNIRHRFSSIQRCVACRRHRRSSFFFYFLTYFVHRVLVVLIDPAYKSTVPGFVKRQ